MSKNKYLFPLIVMASLFFLFGFITTMNNSMIDFLKDAFALESNRLKQLPNTFFYGAYVLSVPVGLIIHRIGYKNGVLSGLGLVALGFLLCIPLVAMGYIPFLFGVAVFAIGVVLLQVAANPYVNALGAPETAASRLTLTNALNSVATVIAPIFVSLLIVNDTNDPKAVQFPFGVIAVITFVILAIMFFLKLPEIQDDDEDAVTGVKKTYKESAFKYTHVWLGSLAIFFYMGIEIGIPSFFADYSDKLGFNLSSLERTDMLKYYWGGLMVGRLIGIFVLQKFTASGWRIIGICIPGYWCQRKYGGTLDVPGNWPVPLYHVANHFQSFPGRSWTACQSCIRGHRHISYWCCHLNAYYGCCAGFYRKCCSSYKLLVYLLYLFDILCSERIENQIISP